MKKKKYLHFDSANKAKDYARERILKGITQIENNDASRLQRTALLEGVIRVRNVKFQSLLQMENDVVFEYENYIAKNKKSSLGCCAELAHQALDYFLMTDTKTRAEVFQILEGDHVFLVIGRQVHSDPNDPLTWGDEAVICDPWSNKIYSAKDYQSFLQAYYFFPIQKKNSDKTDYINHVGPLRSWHTIAPMPFMHTDYLREQRTITNLNAGFLNKTAKIKTILINFISQLERIQRNISDRDPNNQSKNLVLANKIAAINGLLLEIKNAENTLPADYAPDEDLELDAYRVARTSLKSVLNTILKKATTALVFSEEDKEVLRSHRAQEKLTTKVMMFFNQPPASQNEINTACKDTLQAFKAL